MGKKRFIDTDLILNPWFRKLPDKYKLFWVYLFSQCDSVGVWIVDLEIASLVVGNEVDEGGAKAHFGDRLHVFDEGQKWLLVDFIDFQYGVLQKASRPHRSYLELCEKYKKKYEMPKGWLTLPIPLGKGMHTLKDKDSLTKSKSSEGGVQRGKQFKPPTIPDLDAHAVEKGWHDFDSHAFLDHYESNGWKVGKNPMKSWRAAASGWHRRQNEYQGNNGSQQHKPKVVPTYRELMEGKAR